MEKVLAAVGVMGIGACLVFMYDIRKDLNEVLSKMEVHNEETNSRLAWIQRMMKANCDVIPD